MIARILDTSQAGITARTLVSADGRLRATFLPSLNMLCSSLVHEGEELLHPRAGISAYAEHGKTCGIPLLHPWANRLSGDRYDVDGQVVVMRDTERPLGRDGNGLPNHGLLGGPTVWRVEHEKADATSATLTASFDFASEGLLANFPFPHRLEIRARIGDGELAITTTLTPTTAQRVPVSFGYHPYFRLPGVPRDEWILTMPVREHLLLDERSIPTGVVEKVDIPRAPLGKRTFDDAFTAIAAPRLFALEDGRRRLAIEFDEAYPFAQVYAPAGSDFVCFEPMTAPTNALVSGGANLPFAEAGSSFSASFTIRIEWIASSPPTSRA